MRQTESLFLAGAEENLERAVAAGGGVAADAVATGFAVAIGGVGGVAAAVAAAVGAAVAVAAVIDGVGVVADFAGAGSVGVAAVDATRS